MGFSEDNRDVIGGLRERKLRETAAADGWDEFTGSAYRTTCPGPTRTPLVSLEND